MFFNSSNKFVKFWICGTVMGCVLGILFAAQAWADEASFTFNIPVELSNMPKQVKIIRIYAEVGVPEKGGIRWISRNHVTEDLDDGSFNKTVSIQLLSLVEGLYPGMVTTWAVSFVLGVEQFGDWHEPDDGLVPWTQSKKDSVTISKIIGNFQPQDN